MIHNNIKTSDTSHIQDMWTLLVVDFRAKTYQLQEQWKELTATEAVYGTKCLEYVGRLDPNTLSLKTAQLSLLEDLNKSYATFPKSGMMRNGNVYRTLLLDTHTREREYTLLPTPTKSDYKATYAKVEALNRYLESGHQIRTMDLLCQKGFTKCQRIAISEMMMGLNIGHTELLP